MPRRRRVTPAGIVFHVLNRGNERARIFGSDAEYQIFEELLAAGLTRESVDLLAYCVMPNHFHLVLRPQADRALSKLMHWLTTAHAIRVRTIRQNVGNGHIYQGTFKSFPVQTDRHLFAVCRYVEQNPVKGGLALRASDWRWSSASPGIRPRRRLRLAPWPIPRPPAWSSLLDIPQTAAELDALQKSVDRGVPYGDEGWARDTAFTLKLDESLRPPGRPRGDRRRPRPPRVSRKRG